MFLFEEDASFIDDREDLIGLLKLRFGEVPPNVIEAIYHIDKYDTIERLIIVAANAPTFNVFLEELKEGSGSFKILGERFNPIESLNEGGDPNAKS